MKVTQPARSEVKLVFSGLHLGWEKVSGDFSCHVTGAARGRGDRGGPRQRTVVATKAARSGAGHLLSVVAQIRGEGKSSS